MKRLRLALYLIPVSLVLATAALGLTAWRALEPPVGGRNHDEIQIEIASGFDAAMVLDLLESRGVIRNATIARLYLVHVLDDPPLKAGEYVFSSSLSARQVLRKLIRGEVSTHPATVVEGLTLEETARALAASGFGTTESLILKMKDPSPILDLDPLAPDLEGYLFPDTYLFARGTSEERIVAALVRNFRRQFPHSLLEVGEERTIREVVTLASIVEKETRLAHERPLVAGVFSRRLRMGMALAADPTIIFALKRSGDWDGNLRRPDLKLDSPYNTYIYSGLPPGPICSPGLNSLQAAASPPETDYLYFVSRNDGSHVFSQTLSEHNRNVHRWQKQYWRKRWSRSGGEQPGDS